MSFKGFDYYYNGAFYPDTSAAIQYAKAKGWYNGNDDDDKPPAGAGHLRLIGLTGRARSGKDTVGQMLKEEFKAALFSFAQPIRDGLAAMVPGLGYDHFHGDKKEKVLYPYGKSPRQMMQYLGTEWGRNLINENMWLLIAQAKIDEVREQFRHVVITDVRFENEAKFIRDQGGVIWHIERADAPQINAHASENGVAFMHGDVLISNNHGLDDLFDTVCDEF